jgi:hypothetical protein
VQRPAGWANQKVLYDAKRPHRQGLAVSTIHGDLLWVDGGWPGSCHEHELIQLAGLQGALDEVEVASLLGPRGSADWPGRASTGMRQSGTRRTRDRLALEDAAQHPCERRSVARDVRRGHQWRQPLDQTVEATSNPRLG